MGKIKQESQDEGMDIQGPQTVPKKNKSILKRNKIENRARSESQPTKMGADLVRSVAKSVNLKSKHKSLEQKQEIFSKIVKGLQQKSELSKKNRKKSRVMLKKELKKYLDEQRIHGRKKSQDLEHELKVKTQNVQIKNPEKFRKKQIDQRAKAAQFHQLMGAGLNNIRNMIAKNTFANRNEKRH